MDLTKEKIVTYRAGSPPLTRRETLELLKAVPGWSIADGHLIRRFTFNSSKESLSFINDVMGFSQAEGHLPDINLREGRIVEVSYYTYPAGGLTWNDFIMAAKLNERGYGEK
ncbi:MAG: 4a-hydroxytetrahydrobiopterin dehydratase [Methanoregula sp.]|jgi:4a-hydroxytetrahydrobiopterin dehydratase|nr:4a-hydroxytetrahydrobiopterin dehydratase [Methanoregula sp.]